MFKMEMKRVASASALLLAVLGLVGCSAGARLEDEPPPCPRVSFLSEAATLTRFRPGQGRDITDLELAAELTGYHGSCDYDKRSNSMLVTLQFNMTAQRGPAAQGRNAELSYFIAMPTFFPEPKAKQVLPVSLAFPDNTDRVRYTDGEVTITFPIKDVKEMARYEIFAGFQLTQQEVDYNRDKALRK